MQCNSTRFTTGILLNFLRFIKNYPACRPAACKKFQQSQLGQKLNRKKKHFLLSIVNIAPVSKTTINQSFMKLKHAETQFMDRIMFYELKALSQNYTWDKETAWRQRCKFTTKLLLRQFSRFQAL